MRSRLLFGLLVWGVLVGCQASGKDLSDSAAYDGESGEPDTGSAVPLETQITYCNGMGRVNGIVRSRQGDLLSGVEASLSDLDGNLLAQDETGGQGAFLFRDVAAGETHVITIEDSDWLAQARRVEVSDCETVSVEFVLSGVDVVESFEAADGDTLTCRQLELEVPPYAFVDDQDEWVTGMVELSLTAPNPSDTDEGRSPGDFLGTDRQGEDRYLVSFGLFEVQARADGEPVQLGSDVDLTFRYEVADDLSNERAELLGSTVSLWQWHQGEARWSELGSLAVETGASGLPHIEGTLEALGAYDLAETYSPSCAEVRILDAAGSPVPGAEVSLVESVTDSDGYAGGERGATDFDGYTELWGYPVDSTGVRGFVSLDGSSYAAEVGGVALAESGGGTCDAALELTVPACIVGGEMLVHTRTGGEESSSELHSAHARFFEPMSGTDSCEPAWDDLAFEACTRVGEGEELLPDDFSDDSAGDDLETLDAGDWVCISDFAGREICLEPEFEGNAVTYALAEEEVKGADAWLETETPYGVLVQGTYDDVPGVLVTDAVTLPENPELRDGGEVPPFDRDAGLELDIPAGYSENGLFVTLETLDHEGNPDPSSRVVCRFPDEGAVTVPSSALTFLRSGELAITASRVTVGGTLMDNGYVFRTTVINSFEVETEAR